ncbi:hypothetical protein [Bacillus thuringiensis]|uniref:hypothetical protein n=1 Tax=Bacillus thuringiensis TaxID=1428 RepID=UPI001EDE61BD|nr:hypothetical protein [Bacillus thuringiensis]MCG3425513.1 hypothetical protein [Bacillus thuringiensis]
MSLEKKKKGWYLEIKYKEHGQGTLKKTYDNYSVSKEVASRFIKDTEKVTSKALKLAIKEGIFHKVSDPKNIIVHLNNYEKGVIKSRYEMVFNDVANGLVGCYKGWEYYTIDEGGNAEPFEYSYSPIKVFVLPIIFLILLCLLFLSNFMDISLNDTFKIIYTFLAFYLMLVYSVMLLLNKDIAKNHFVKGKFNLLFIATLIFESPYWVATLISIHKISSINGELNYGIFSILCVASFIFLILKFALSMALENEKMKV